MQLLCFLKGGLKDSNTNPFSPVIGLGLKDNKQDIAIYEKGQNNRGIYQNLHPLFGLLGKTIPGCIS